MPSAPLIQMRHSDRHCEHRSQAFGRVATCIDSGSHGFSKGGWIVERSTISVVAHPAHHPLNVERSTSAPLVAVPAATLDVERSTFGLNVQPRPTELRLRPPPTLSHPASTPLNPAAKRGSVLLGSSKLNVKKPMTWT